MRPTLLGFRSPKEQTPGPYYPTLTAKGHTISFNSPKAQQRRILFTSAPRFTQYAVDSRRTGCQVGPGSYSPEQYREPVAGTPLCKSPPQLGNEGYFYVGDHLVRQPITRLGRRGSVTVTRKGQTMPSPPRTLEHLYKTVRRSSSPLIKKNDGQRSTTRRAWRTGKPPSRVSMKRTLCESVN